MREGHSHTKYFVIWLWLVGFLLAGVAASRLPLPEGVLIPLIFGTAVVKAILVALYYMHMKTEHFLVTAIALTPVLLFVILTLALFPDFVYHQ